MLTERFGWTGPPDGKQGSHDYVSASNCFYCCHNPMALMYNYHSNLSFVVSLCVYSSHLSCSSIRMSLQSCLRFHSSVHLQFTFTTLSIQHWHLSEWGGTLSLLCALSIWRLEGSSTVQYHSMVSIVVSMYRCWYWYSLYNWHIIRYANIYHSCSNVFKAGMHRQRLLETWLMKRGTTFSLQSQRLVDLTLKLRLARLQCGSITSWPS